MDNTWYVYKHVRLDTNEPFYIGIGKTKNYKRAYEIDPSKRNIIWNRIVSKSVFSVHILCDNLSKNEAASKEKELIKKYGRIDIGTGCLCNMTDGGDGVWNKIMTQETRQKIRESKIGERNHMFGKKRTTEQIEATVRANTGRKDSKEIIEQKKLMRFLEGQSTPVRVLRYSDKSLVGYWYSMSEACRELNIEGMSGKASQVAKRKRNQVKGYVFRYLNDKRIDVIEIGGKNKIIFDPESGVYYMSIGEASDILGISSQTLNRRIRGQSVIKTNLVYA